MNPAADEEAAFEALQKKSCFSVAETIATCIAEPPYSARVALTAFRSIPTN